jgi:hypothetical protein
MLCPRFSGLEADRRPAPGRTVAKSQRCGHEDQLRTGRGRPARTEAHALPGVRNTADNTKVTATRWHITAANGLGCEFDGMVGVIFAVVVPMVIKDSAPIAPGRRSPCSSASSASIFALDGRSGRAAEPAGDQYRHPVIMVMQAIIIWVYSPEYGRRELNEIAV